MEEGSAFTLTGTSPEPPAAGYEKIAYVANLHRYIGGGGGKSLGVDGDVVVPRQKIGSKLSAAVAGGFAHKAGTVVGSLSADLSGRRRRHFAEQRASGMSVLAG